MKPQSQTQLAWPLFDLQRPCTPHCWQPSVACIVSMQHIASYSAAANDELCMDLAYVLQARPVRAPSQLAL